MAIQNSEPDAVTKAAHIIFPNSISFFTETLIGLFLLGISLFREWDLPSTVTNDSGIMETIRGTFNDVSDTVSRTSFGRAVVTIIFWLLVGIVCYVIVTKAIAYFSAAWRVVDEKKHDVFPRWYSGGSLFHDTAIIASLWLLRHAVALVLFIFSAFFCLPISVAYAHVGVFGESSYVYILYALLTLIFAARLFGMALCILSKKVTAWYAH